MGYFSWITQDSDRSIPNRSSNKRTFPVYMIDDKGNKWKETDYEGYGEFGGKDYFQLLAEMNGIATGDLESDRSAGIDLAFTNNPEGDNPDCLFPNLVENQARKWINQSPKSCEFQGFFYP